MSMSKLSSREVIVRVLLVVCTMLASYAPSAFARHGEGSILTNRIPEPAAYEYSETIGGGGQTQNPPFENLWTSKNDVGSCSGCHTGLYDQWNGSMMANAWRDPGWRGAFLLVARLTSTDGCKDITDAVTAAFGGTLPDNSQHYNCAVDPLTNKLISLNPFAASPTTSTYNVTPPGFPPGLFGGVTPAPYSGSGSLMDDFCSRCHMPTNYVDATIAVTQETPAGQAQSYEHGHISPTYDPTSVNPTATIVTSDPLYGLARESFAERGDSVAHVIPGATVFPGNRPVNTNSGKIGIVCEVCHANVASRHTPYHNYAKSGVDYYPATKIGPRGSNNQDGTTNTLQNLTAAQQDMISEPDPNSPNFGYAIGAGAFRLSPHALDTPERFGPLSWNNFTSQPDSYLTAVFSGGKRPDGTIIGTSPGTSPLTFVQARPPGKHDTFYQVKFERAEFCGTCHDVTNPATIKNQFGKWVGGFPIERTYTEYLNSRYSSRKVKNAQGAMVQNPYFDANFKRDCQTCHMQQSFGQPGTALTLYNAAGVSDVGAYQDPTPDSANNTAALSEPSCDRIIHNPGYSHHFVGGNAYVTKMIGADVSGGTVTAYPELLETSFTSKNDASRFHYARFDSSIPRRGAPATQHERFAWDRLRNALKMTLTAPPSVTVGATGGSAIISIVVKNEGAGHNFPTGFPEGRAAWVAVRAFDTNNTPGVSDDTELDIKDNVTAKVTKGVGYLTATDMADPRYAGCNFKLPAGSIDPYAITFRAVATLDGTCPTLDLPYAYAKNLDVNATTGVPKDASGVAIDRNNPNGIPVYADTNNDGDFFDDSFLEDTRLGPARKAGTTQVDTEDLTGRYSVIVPAGKIGPITVSSVVYYQSFEAVVAQKFLGNLANTDDVDTSTSLGLTPVGGPNIPAPEGLPGGRPILEPCVLKGPCDRFNKPERIGAAPGTTGKAELRKALLYDPVVVEGAPPVPVVVASTTIRVNNATDSVAPEIVINNSTLAPNTTATIPANMHWSPSPYGGQNGNYGASVTNADGIGEQNVDPARVVKITFSEPVTGVTANTFYLTDSRNRSITALLSQIDDTTWALFPYSAIDKTFLSQSVNVIHIAPSRNGSTIKDVNGLTLKSNVNNPSGEYTFAFKIM